MLTFDPLFPLAILFISCLSLFALVFYKYRNLNKTLLTLRSITVILLTFLAMRPAVVSTKKTTHKEKLYFLTDISDSMTIKDEGGLTRSEALNEALLKNEELLKQLKEVYNLKEFDFASVLTKIKNSETSTLSTSLGRALNETANDSQINKVKGILLFSDGLNNNGQSINKAIDSLNKKLIPVHTLTLGQSEFEGEIVDGIIHKMNCPDKVKFKNDFTIRTEFDIKGLMGKKASLEVYINDIRVKSKEQNITSKEQAFSEDLTIETTAFSPGYHKVSTKLITNEKEITPKNNSIDTYFQIIDRSLKVLLIATSPSAEYKFMRRMLQSFEDIDTVAPNPFYIRGQAGKEYFSKLSIEDYDLIAFQNPDFKLLPETFLNNCQKYLNSQRAGIIFSGASINEKLNSNSLFSDFTFTGGEKETLKHSDSQLELTVAGQSHFITAFLNEEDLTKWPTLSGVVNENKSMNSPLLSLEGIPILVTSSVKNARLIWLNSNSLWQLMNNESSKDSCRTLWLRMIYYLTSREKSLSSRLSLISDKSRVLAGEEFNLKADLLNEKSLPVKNQEITLEITKDNQEPSTTKLNKNNYLKTFNIKEEGLYTFTASVEYNDEKLKSNMVKVFVQEPRIEFNRILSDKTVMDNIAKATDGQTLSLNTMNTFLKKLISESKIRTTSTITAKKEIWDNLFSFIIVCLLLCLEWQIRRSKGFM